MYVCLCHGYTDSQIRRLVEEGVTSAAEAYERLGETPECGKCLDEAQAVIDQDQRRRRGLDRVMF